MQLQTFYIFLRPYTKFIKKKTFFLKLQYFLSKSEAKHLNNVSNIKLEIAKSKLKEHENYY